MDENTSNTNGNVREFNTFLSSTLKVFMLLVVCCVCLQAKALENDSTFQKLTTSEKSQAKLVRLGTKAEKSGAFFDAIHYVVDALTTTKRVKEKHTKEAHQLLQRIYPKAIQQSNGLIQQLEEFSQPHAGIETVHLHERLVKVWKRRVSLQQKISELPDSYLKPGTIPSDESSELKRQYDLVVKRLDDVKQVQADLDFEDGVKLLAETQSHGGARLAYQKFSRCLELIPDYKDALALRKNALERGTVKVFISPLLVTESESEKGHASDVLNQLFFNDPSDIVEPLFVELIASPEMADLIITTTLTKVEVGNNRREPDVQHLEKTIKDGDKETVIKGTATYFEKFSVASIVGNFEVKGPEGNVLLKSDQLWGQKTWTNGWVSYNDERVLTRKLKIYKGKKELPFPDPKLVLNDAAREFSRYLRSGISQYLNLIGG